MFRQSVIFLALAMSANGLSYVYQLVMARLLEPEEFAVVLAIVSFIAILVFPANSYQVAVAVGTGHLVQRGSHLHSWPFASRAALFGGAVGLGFVALFGVFASGIREVFGFHGNWILAWLAVTFCFSLVLSALRGALQGTHRFAGLGTVMLVEAGSRVLLAVALVWWWDFAVAGATAGFAFSFVAATLLAIWLLYPRTDLGGPAHESLWPTLRAQLRSVPATFAIFGVQAIDVVIANSRLPNTPMESFSAAALAGRVIFYAWVAFGLLLLPRFRHVFAGAVLRRDFVLKTAAVVAAIVMVPVVMGFAVPDLIHTLLVGANYEPDAGLLQRYLIGSALLTTALFLTYVMIAAGRNWIAYGLVPIAAAQFAMYISAADTTFEFARILIIAGAAMCLFLVIPASLLIRKQMRLQPDLESGLPAPTPSDAIMLEDISTRDPI